MKELTGVHRQVVQNELEGAQAWLEGLKEGQRNFYKAGQVNRFTAEDLASRITQAADRVLKLKAELYGHPGSAGSRRF